MRLNCWSSQTENTIKPDVVLVHANKASEIHVFGLDHRQIDNRVGVYLLQVKPDALVVETSITPAHGSMTGNLMNCTDYDPSPAGVLQRSFCQIATQIQKEGVSEASPLWKKMQEYYTGEQLAYIAALSHDIPIVYGDRPKDITYRRIFSLCSSVQLDQAFGLSVMSNYNELLTGKPLPLDLEQLQLVDVVLMREREAVLCRVADELCSGTLPQLPDAGPLKRVVLLTGADHLRGLQQLWEEGSWRFMLGNGQLAHSEVMGAPILTDQDMVVPGAGVRRALLAAYLAYNTSPAVLEYMDEVLPPLPAHHSNAYSWTFEMYMSSRMQMACLPEHMLRQVCEGVGCDFFSLLEPLRRIRPLNGGSGYDEDLGLQLRALNFEVE